MDGMRVSVCSPPAVLSHLTSCVPVIWPCDIRGFLDNEGNMDVVNYILDDVSMRPPIPSLILTPAL